MDAFAALKQRAATALFERMGTRFNDSAIKEDELRTSAREELIRIIDAEQVPLTAEERSRLVRTWPTTCSGYGPLQRLLDDPDVTEIMVNRMDQIYVERNGQLTLTESRFSSEDHLRKVIERIVSKVGRRIDESSPLVDARLEDGSRVNAVIPPLAVGGSSLTIRKFSKVPLTVRNLIEFGTLTPEMAELLNACVKAKLNIIVSGGTGTGKTTLLNVLSSFLPARRAHRDHRGRRRTPDPAGATWCGWKAGRRTPRARAKSPSANCCATPCVCARTASWWVRSAAANRWTCSRP